MSLTKSVFGTFPCGKTADAYTLKNASGVTLVLTNYGCRILQLLTPDKSGKLGDVVLGHATLEEYFGSDFQEVGAFRIASCSFPNEGFSPFSRIAVRIVRRDVSDSFG